MGDIKSTLDLVMARTSHLSLSEEERQKQKNEENKKKIQGLIQRYLDQGFTIDRFHKDLQKLKNATGEVVDGLLKAALADKIDLSRNMDGLFKLMAALDGIDPAPFQAIYSNYQTERAEAAQNLRTGLARELDEKQGIRGTAVVPNIEAAPAWIEINEKLTQKYNRHLDNARQAFEAE